MKTDHEQISVTVSPLQWAPEEPWWPGEPRINAAIATLYAEPPNTWLNTNAIAELAEEKYGFEYPWDVEFNFGGEWSPEAVGKALYKVAPGGKYSKADGNEFQREKLEAGSHEYWYKSVGVSHNPINEADGKKIDEKLVEKLYSKMNMGTHRLDGFTFDRFYSTSYEGADTIYAHLLELLCEGRINRHYDWVEDEYEYWIDDETVDQESDALEW